ncbi:MAG: hypothetical protein IPL26_03650 [Leptospiraceae bacterium]|nr:hypothetical protein [Leptospiraceae bacterium]
MRVLYIILFILFGCTNYSVSKTKIVPPILVSIGLIDDSNGTVITNAYRITMRVTNQELFFAGYKLYVGKDENSARNPSDLNSGQNCTVGPSLIPNQPIEYTLEIADDINKLPASSKICSYQATLNSGEYISVRSLLLSIQPSNQGGNQINPSLPSNTLIVP